ncbi:hypothetical protein DFJ77DRAFT_317922 [Powellomyces hirtus]|nr:hypothetical protein DFJ77DRAFT_317922 [Powellomyces hirtus]
MHATFAASLLVSSMAASVMAQSAPYLDGTWKQIQPEVINCGPDILVDDFSNPRQGRLPLQGETADRWLDLLGGDYGKSGVGMEWSITTAGAALTPTSKEAFFFFKLDAGACYDLTSINSLVFDVVAPAGSNFAMGLTQKTPDCKERVGGETGISDSPYVDLTKYITPNGQKQTVVLPFQDIKGAGDKLFDFAHLKDVTFINWTPPNVETVISNIHMRRACNGNGPTGTNTTVSTGSSPGAVPPQSSPTADATPAPSSTTDLGATATATPSDAASANAGTEPKIPNGAQALAITGLGLSALVAGVLALI